MKSDQIINNVQSLMDKYGDRISDDKKLILTYWKDVDQIQINKEYISTVDFLTKSTPANLILDARFIVQMREGTEQ